jgi:hypothetical protein
MILLFVFGSSSSGRHLKIGPMRFWPSMFRVTQNNRVTGAVTREELRRIKIEAFSFVNGNRRFGDRGKD